MEIFRMTYSIWYISELTLVEHLALSLTMKFRPYTA